MALGNVMRGRREVGRSFRGRGMVRGHGRGMHRAPGLGTFRGLGVAPPSRRPLGVDTRPSSLKIAKSFKRTNDMAWRHDLFEDSVVAASGHSGAEDGGAKLYISNLDFRVSNNDIKELFSELGELKRYGVHYDNHGRPNGSAEVVFVRRSDAVGAFKKYNNVQLDGKPMKIELIGMNVGLPVMPRFNVVATAHGRGKRTVVMMSETNRRGAGPSNRVASGGRRGRGGSQHGHMNGNGFGRGRGGGRGRGRSMGGRSGGNRGRGGRGFWRRADKSAAQLDKELDNYHAQAMNTS